MDRNPSHIARTHSTWALWCWVLLVLCQPGCAFVSNTLHQAADFLAPRRTCQQCGGNTCVCPPHDPLVPPVGPGGVAPPAEVSHLHERIELLEADAAVHKDQFANMAHLLDDRQEELMQTRAELKRIRGGVEDLTQQVSQWQTEMSNLQDRLTEDDQRRTQQLQELTRTISDLADEQEQASTEAILESIRE